MALTRLKNKGQWTRCHTAPC